MTTMDTTAVLPGITDPLGRRLSKDMRREGFLGAWGVWQREFGDIYLVAAGGRNTVVALHPDAVQHVTAHLKDRYDKAWSYDTVRKLMLGDGLVTSTGPLWRRQRRLMAPFFTPRGIEQFARIMIDDGQMLVRRWETLAASGEEVEIGDEMMRVTASIILKTMFGMDSDEEVLRLKEAVETQITYVSQSQFNPLRLPLWVPTAENRKFKAATKLVDDYIQGIIAQRRALPQDQWPDDLLTRLMLAKDDETGEMMNDRLLRDESVTVFFAGHETTARTLMFTWYALARNPDVADRLHAEVDAVLGDAPPTLEDLKRLPYTLQVIKETLRLYPAAPMYVRDAIADDVIMGYAVPKGSTVMLIPYWTHRHPEFWPDPERFDPDRWTPEAEAARHPYAFHPFATGQRICIGNNFSLLESHILLSMLVRRYRAVLRPGHVAQVDATGTLYSKNGLPMRIEVR